MEWARALIVCGGFLFLLEVAETFLGRTVALMIALVLLLATGAVLVASRP